MDLFVGSLPQDVRNDLVVADGGIIAPAGPDPGIARLRLTVLASAFVLALLSLGLITALSATESDRSLTAMVAVGARPRLRRFFLGLQTGYHALVGAVLAVPLALLLMLVLHQARGEPVAGLFGIPLGHDHRPSLDDHRADGARAPDRDRRDHGTRGVVRPHRPAPPWRLTPTVPRQVSSRPTRPVAAAATTPGLTVRGSRWRWRWPRTRTRGRRCRRARCRRSGGLPERLDGVGVDDRGTVETNRVMIQSYLDRQSADPCGDLGDRHQRPHVEHLVTREDEHGSPLAGTLGEPHLAAVHDQPLASSHGSSSSSGCSS